MAYDVVVVGGGHAGTEAAAAAARRGARVALVTFDPAMVGAMSCNPAIGGVGKGHIVREVDAFDGLIARAADAAGIHYRMLNLSKGAAVWGPRVQADRRRYAAEIRALLADRPGLATVAGEAAELVLREGRIAGVVLADGGRIAAPAVVLATGTFLGGRIFRGEERMEGGRIGERAAHRIAAQLRELALPIRRLKTGTPPRLDGRSIDWARLERQESDSEPWTMSPVTAARVLPQLFCAITRTRPETHAIIRAALDRSPLYSGTIEGAGPRYCPSIEDKVERFGDRDGHQIFLEPEGLDDGTVYPNGISTSLPVDVQERMLRSIAGLEQVRIRQPGYAVEYDHLDPRDLSATLELRALPGLFLAGQVNGTTGYEEAAGQGLVAGLNAAACALDLPRYAPSREDSYLGVMIDDLVLQGVTEPYRMLTARAEHRLRLRADNAEARLGAAAERLGCLSDERIRRSRVREAAKARAEQALDRIVMAEDLIALGCDVRRDGVRRPLREWLRQPGVNGSALEQAGGLDALDPAAAAEAVQDARYAPYVDRQQDEVRALRDADVVLPCALDYAGVVGLSHEMVERLDAARPASLQAAARIRGVTPAALTAILFHARARA